MPFPSGAIRVEISPPNGDTVLHGNLWDLTHNGCCVVVDGQADELVDSNCGLTIKDPATGSTLKALAQLEWCDDTIRNCFCGFRFVTPMALPRGTFLDDYLPEQPSTSQSPEDPMPSP
ncbi:hypothetical protein [Vulcanococcus limneticus]|uniref:hypothetical protein n=1 Tax=Vulcanococcus limneticus TaxID=2170428 RepID=UPI00398BE806